MSIDRHILQTPAQVAGIWNWGLVSQVYALWAHISHYTCYTWQDLSVAIVVAHAFTTSQSATAHHILFHRIFAIAEEDTGQPVCFRHIHGYGFDSFMADGHKGQALGMWFAM